MGWEKRAGRYYYYQTRKVNGRVVRQYIGAGDLAATFDALDTLDRDRHQAAAADRRAQQQRLDELDDQLDQFCRLTDCLVSGAFLLAGYHRHNRGDWRKRRD